MFQNISNHSIKSEIKNTLSLGIPLITSQLIWALSGFIGTAMMAHLGKDALAASVLVNQIWWSFIILFIGILNAITVLVSHQFGANNQKAISVIMGQAYLFGIIISILLILILSSMPFLLRWSGQPPAVLNLSYQFIHALLLTIPGLIVLVINQQFLAGIGRTKLALRLGLLIVPFEIPLIYIFVFGKLGLPAFGVSGIAYGFAITNTIAAIGLTLYLSKSKHYKIFKIFKGIRKIDLVYLKELIHIGLPMGLMSAIEMSTFAIATFWMSFFGTTILAAHQIVLQYLGLIITIVLAMSQTVTVRVGHAVGRQDLIGVKYAAYVGMILNFLCVLLFALVFYLFPNILFRVDLDINNLSSKMLINNASLLLSISGILLLFDNFRIIGFGALRGLKDTRFPMVTSLLGFWLIGLSSAFILGFIFHLGGQGIWWGLTIGIIVSAITVLIRLQFLLRRIDLAKLARIGER